MEGDTMNQAKEWELPSNTLTPYSGDNEYGRHRSRDILPYRSW